MEENNIERRYKHRLFLVLSASLNFVGKATRITDRTGSTTDDWWYMVDCGNLQLAVNISGGYSWTPQLWIRHIINGSMSAWIKAAG